MLRRYLQERLDLGEPGFVLTRATRGQTLRALRGGPETPGRSAPERPASGGADSAAWGDRSTGPRSAPDRSSAEARSEPELPPEELVRLGNEATEEEILGLPDLVTLRAVAERCRRCPLHETRQTVVFGEGDPDARVVCVGEAPGAREDETGRPFVGRAGELLDRLLMSAGFPRERVYICNVLKSRPPNNRDPLPEEIAACSPYLLRQLELIDPRVIVAFGAFAARTLLESRESLGRLRGRWHEFRGYPVIVTYHPAALLRNPGWTRPTWEDLQLVRRIADGVDVSDWVAPGRRVGVGAPAGEAEGVDAAGDAVEDSAQGGLFG